jgi:nucleoside-diphosphate-sugar epimerase
MTQPERRHVFVAGGTGYIGSRLCAALLARGHRVTAVAREGSEHKLPAGCEVVAGNVLDRSTYENAIAPAQVFVQLVGVPHPNPSKAKQFREIDLASAKEAIAAASNCGSIGHFVYLSVAHPAPMMHAYIAARTEGEECLSAAVGKGAFRATVLRPWYVLGPGHRWPYALVPLYWIAERIPATRAQAMRLGLVTLAQMVQALVHCVEGPDSRPPAPDSTPSVTILNVPEIRAA